MKRIKGSFIFITILILLPFTVNAANANINVSGSGSAVVGNKITLTVKLSAGSSWEMDLNYDSSYLQFIGGGGEAGGMTMVNTVNGNPSRSYTFSFKVLKSGSTTVKVNNYYVVADDFSVMNTTSSGKTIKIMTQAELEASYSKDNNLKSLSVEGYEISPEFKKDTLEYTVNVPEGTKTINIIANENDKTATVSGAGEVEVGPGTNSFDIVVKAQNGAEKTYKLTVNVIDENPVNIKIDGKKYTLIKYQDAFTCPETYELSTKNISSFDVPVCTNKKIKYTLVGLKDEEGTIILARYEKDNYSLYNEIKGNSLTVIPLKFKGEIKGYINSTIKINDKEVECYKYQKDSKTSIIYGLNLLTGKKEYYIYDEINKSFTIYDDEYISSLENLNKYYLYATILFGSALLLSIFVIISINKKKKKHKNNIEEVVSDIEAESIISEEKNNKSAKKISKKKDENEIIEVSNEESVSEETEVYDIFENDKKKKKRSKK